MSSSSSTITLAQTSNSTACFTSIALSTQVIDSGASDYMIGNKGILSTLNSLFSLLFVTLADGFKSYIECVGVAKATPFLSLSSVLYIPKFSFNLLSVSRVTKS